MIKLAQQFVDIVVQSSYLIFRAASILYFFHFFDNIACYLFSPFLTFVQIIDFSNVSETFGTFIILSVN